MAEKNNDEMILIVAGLAVAGYLLLKKKTVMPVTPTNSLTATSYRAPAQQQSNLSLITSAATSIANLFKPSSSNTAAAQNNNRPTLDLTTGQADTNFDFNAPGTVNTGLFDNYSPSVSDPFNNISSPIFATDTNDSYSDFVNDYT